MCAKVNCWGFIFWGQVLGDNYQPPIKKEKYQNEHELSLLLENTDTKNNIKYTSCIPNSKENLRKEPKHYYYHTNHQPYNSKKKKKNT
jgi:hypothetical protein